MRKPHIPANEKDAKYLDMSKLLFDLLKHVATLSSASILAVVTIAEKVLAVAHYPWQLKFAIWLFVASILSSLMGMILMAFGVGPKGLGEPEKKWFAAIFVLTAFLFAAAFTFLAAIATST